MTPPAERDCWVEGTTWARAKGAGEQGMGKNQRPGEARGWAESR